METENLTIEETEQTETPVEETAPAQPAEIAEEVSQQEETFEQEEAADPGELPPKPAFYKTARFWELVVGGLTVLCILIFIIVAPMVKLTDGGPIFYNAPRLGKNGKIFNMYKFRSMRVNAPDIRNADGSTYNADDDPRVTKIGKILRETSLDETPQIFNVLLGDMSIIGPRAHLTTNFHGLEQASEQDRKRLSVLPGITGYSQAYYRNNATQQEKVECDVYYAQNLSFILDVKILFRTVWVVLKRENVYVTTDMPSEKETVKN